MTVLKHRAAYGLAGKAKKTNHSLLFLPLTLFFLKGEAALKPQCGALFFT